MIEPGTGSNFLQCIFCGIPFGILVGVLAGVAYFVKKGKKGKQSVSTNDHTS